MADNNTDRVNPRCGKHPDLTFCMMVYDELPKEIREALGKFFVNYCPSCIKEVIDRGSPVGSLIIDLHALDMRYAARYRAEYERGAS